MQAQCSACLLSLCRSLSARRIYSTYGNSRRPVCSDENVYAVRASKFGLRTESLARLIRHGAHPRRRARPNMGTADNVVALRPLLAAGSVETIEVHPPARVALFTRQTLASYLNLHVNTVDRLIKRGEIPAYRVSGKVRFYPEDVERYIHDHREVV